MEIESKRSNSLQVLIVGLGNVGFYYDTSSPSQILSHTTGIITAAKVYDLEIEITGVDPILNKRRLFEERNNFAKAYESIKQLPSKNFDLVIFACPTPELTRVFLECQETLTFQKAVIEKPVALTLEQYESFDYHRKQEIDIKVGFPRRTIPSTHYLKNLLKMESKESLYRIELQLGGNILNIGSHFLDLIHFLFGSFAIDDYWEKCNMVGLKASSPNLELLVEQVTHENNERSEIKVCGPVNFRYSFAGRRLEFSEPDLNTSWVYDATSEIQGMLGFEAMDYIGWVARGKGSSLPNLYDTPVRQLLERMQ